MTSVENDETIKRLSKLLRTTPDQVVDKVTTMIDDVERMKKEIEDVRRSIEEQNVGTP